MPGILDSILSSMPDEPEGRPESKKEETQGEEKRGAYDYSQQFREKFGARKNRQGS